MDWDVIEAQASEDYLLHVKFRDGTQGIVKFLPSFFRGIFQPLHEHDQFRQVKVVDGVVTWPGDLDLAPDAMHNVILSTGKWVVD